VGVPCGAARARARLGAMLAHGYASSSEEETAEAAPPRARQVRAGVELAPSVAAARAELPSAVAYARPLADGAVVAYNPSAGALGAPAGPPNPFAHVAAQGARTHVDEAAFEAGLYDQQQHLQLHQLHQHQHQGAGKKRQRREHVPEVRLQEGSLWGAEEGEEESEGGLGAGAGAIPEEQKRFLELGAKRFESANNARKEAEAAQGERGEVRALEGAAGATSSQLIAPEALDYQGRSWVLPPPGLRAGEAHECALPRRRVHTWEGHSKGVQQIEWFPRHAHLLLSGSLDATVRVWGAYESSLGGNGRGCKRVYRGHSAPVRAICIQDAGAEFCSSGYDKRLVLWDVETGQSSLSLDLGSVANDVKFFPRDPNLLLAACADRAVYQWDRREGKVVQRYEHHLSAVNTITFYDDARSFVTTSDDKVMLAWTWQLPVPVKYIQDPSQQSMPVVRHHPTEATVACQSMDNQILTFDVADSVRMNRGKRFKGHNSAGFACDIDFAPSGKIVCSGDSSGKLFFWDWKSGRKTRELQAHDKHPCLGVRWHPIEPSWVATCAWDGLIKLWE
jgi:pre-mRNA-processing factor 17